jgi:hypothetical protein
MMSTQEIVHECFSGPLVRFRRYGSARPPICVRKG